MPELPPFADLERSLELLLPRGLSEQAEERLGEEIERMAEETSLPQSNFWRSLAACLALSVAGVAIVQNSGKSGEVAVQALPDPAEIEVLGRSVWIEEEESLGIQETDNAGNAQAGWSYSGVLEERVKHHESGYEVVLQREFVSAHYEATTF